MSSGAWVDEFPAEVMACDAGGNILEMNSAADSLFAGDGGHGLVGTDLLACHPQPALGKLQGMLSTQAANSYFSTEDGVKRFFFQSPWYRQGNYAGFVEISFEVPEAIPHFIRE